MSADLEAQGLALGAKAAVTAKTAGIDASYMTPAVRLKLLRAISGARSGTYGGLIYMVGDSTTTGQGAGTGASPNTVGARSAAVPARLADILSAAGVPVNKDAVFGNNVVDSTTRAKTAYTSYNPALTFGAGWAIDNNLSLGGYFFRNNNVDTSALTLTPAATFDGFDIYHYGSAGGTFTADIGGAALATVVQTNNSKVAKLSVSTGAAPATGSINLKRVSGNNIIVGIVPTNSVTPRVRLANLGWSGAQASYWSDTSFGWSPGKALTDAPADVVFINLGLNDLAFSVPVATYSANMQAIITAAQAGGSAVILCTPTPQDPATRDPAGLTAAYNAALAALAQANGCGLIDLYSGLGGSYATLNAMGVMRDTVHMQAGGYAMVAGVLGRVLPT